MHQLHQGTFGGKPVSARSRVVVFDERDGVTTAVANESQALDFYVRLCVRPRSRPDKMHILYWSHAQWVEIAPDSIKS